MTVAAVILAAGFSRRLGRPKQTVRLGGELLVQRAVRVAHDAGLSPVFVVLRADAGYAAQITGSGCIVLLNHEADEGMAASIRCGVRAAAGLESIQGVVLMTCDQWATRAEHLRALSASRSRVTGSGYAGRVGVPAYFPCRSFAGLLALKGDVGARELLRGAAVLQAEELALDLDTEEDLARAQQTLASEDQS